MNYKMIGQFIARILAVEAVFMVPALLISLFLGEGAAARGFAVAVVVALACSVGLWWCSRKPRPGFYAREGLVCCGLCWLTLSLVGCLPFWISGEFPSFVDALFEIVSGFTTTGASILPAVEQLSKGILYWRSFSHWVGGMGVLVFLLALAPAGGTGSGFAVHLLRAESPGPDVGKLVPRLRETAKILYLIYLALTVADLVFLLLGRMPLFDAVCTALGTAGTGGFGIRNDSIASYSPYLQNVCTVFMLLFGINFNCYYLLLLRQVKAVVSDEELRLYVGLVVGCTAAIAVNIRGLYGTLGETVRHAAFQVASIITTTGFATTDFDLWPGFSKGVLLCLMVVGASAGSTGGGLKCGRALLLFKGLRRSMRQALHPGKVEVIRINGRKVQEGVLSTASAYLAAYVLIIVGSFLLVSLDGFSIGTNVSAVVSCFNNIGPGFETVGPTCNFGAYSVLSKLVLIWDMLAGRLEIFPILALCSVSAWKKV